MVMKMNDRIDKIIAKSKLEHLDGFAQYEIDAIYNLAELIVRECIRLCDQVDLVGADDCIDNIKDYFEIE